MTKSDSETVSNSSLPLCIDLDGTLIQTDSLWESCLRLISQKPLMLILLLLWLFLGKAGFKEKVSEHVKLSSASLPFNTSLLKYLTQQHLHNHHFVLVTAANKTIASHLNIFDEILASDETHNSSGKNKAEVLVDKFGETSSLSHEYHVDDLPAISLFGISSGYISVLVLVLYTHDLQAGTLYAQPDWLWFVAVAVLYWISRMWLLAFRGQMNEDPALFAIQDRNSYIVTLFIAFSLYLAL